MLARHGRNRRLADALTASPGARADYDTRRAACAPTPAPWRALGNRLVGLLHGCLRHSALYDEHLAWGHRHQLAA